MRKIDADELCKSLRESLRLCCEWCKKPNGRDDRIRAEQARVSFTKAILNGRGLEE